MVRKLVIIRDETLRDGAQQPGINLTSYDRIKLALISAEILNSSSNLVNNQIDLGMPESSQRLLNTIRETTSLLKNYKGIDFFVTGRAIEKSIDIMSDSLRDVEEERKIIAPFIGISRMHRKKLGLTPKDIIRKIKDSIQYAQKNVKRIHFPLEGGYLAY